MKIGIVGGSGSVGKIVAPFLIGNGHHVSNYDRANGQDIFDVARLMEWLEAGGFNVVIHLAAIPHPFLREFTDEEYWEVNYVGSQVVFEACARAGVEGIVYASSGCVYGFWGGNAVLDEFPLREHNYKPSVEEGQSIYGETKIASERFLSEVVSDNHALGAVSLRIEGPGGTPSRKEWIWGLRNLDGRASVHTCPAWHLLGQISETNLQDVVERACYFAVQKSSHLVANVADPFLHYSIDAASLVDRLTSGSGVDKRATFSASLISTELAQSELEWRPSRAANTYPDGRSVDSHYSSFVYFGKAGQP